VTVNEEHKTEEHHEAQTLSSPVVNGSDNADESEDAKETATADTEQPASAEAAEAGPSTDETETTEEAKAKEKGGKVKGFMGFLKSKTRSHSKEREQASEKDKDAAKAKTESEEEDGSKKGDSLEREPKQFKISLFSKKGEDKKSEKDEIGELSLPTTHFRLLIFYNVWGIDVCGNWQVSRDFACKQTQGKIIHRQPYILLCKCVSNYL